MRVLALTSLLLLLLQPACSSTSIGDPGGALNGGPGGGLGPQAPGVGGEDAGGSPSGARDAAGTRADYYNSGGHGQADLDDADAPTGEPGPDEGAPGDFGPAPIDGDVASPDTTDLAEPEVRDGVPSDVPPAEVYDTADGTDPGAPDGDVAGDVGPPPEDTPPDVPSDVPFVWPENAPEPQCRRNADCPTGICSRSAPGGICTGCGVTADCPADHDCNYGGCNLWCDSDDECPVAMRCHPTRHDCVLKSCSDDAECDGPYVCDGGMCRRPECGEEGACPEPLTCEGGMCVEP
jgi:hypothetical protein